MNSGVTHITVYSSPAANYMELQVFRKGFDALLAVFSES